jgi:SAM-dependent methyltransferase
MNDWSRGYPTDTPYTVGWQPYLAPQNLAVVAAVAGIAWEPSESPALLDLGCGRGFSANLIAAVDPRREVIGIDYAPAHIAEARSFAAEAGIGNARFLEADIAALSDAEILRLPEFDAISLHGVWTWVDDSVRAGILRLIRQRLKPGGLVYVGYNALPAFAADMALQRLMRAAATQARGGPIERILAARALLKGFAPGKPPQLHDSPLLQRLLSAEHELNPAYLAHEFLTEHWRPAFFAEVAAAMAEARCDYAGSLTLWENMPDLCFDEAGRAVHESFAATADRELVKDISLTRGFRRDVFVRGLRRVDRHAALEALMLVSALPAGTPAKVQVQHGVAELPEAMAAPVLAALEAGPASIGALRRAAQGRQPNPAELAVILLGSGRALPWCEAPAGHAAAGFNRAAARRYGELGPAPLALAAPACGGGLSAGAGEIALVAALAAGGEPWLSAEALAGRLLGALDDEKRREGAASIAATLAERGPLWRRLGVL